LRRLQRAGAAARLSQLPRYDADGGAAPNPSGGSARGARRRADIDPRNRCRLPLHQSRPFCAAVQRSVRAVPIRAPAGPRSTHGLTGKAAPQLATAELPTIILKRSSSVPAHQLAIQTAGLQIIAFSVCPIRFAYRFAPRGSRKLLKKQRQRISSQLG